MKHLRIKKIRPEHQEIITQFLQKHWGGVEVISRGQVLIANELPGFIVIHNQAIIGLVTYRIEYDQCEIVTLNGLLMGKGIGSRLVDHVKTEALLHDCQRIWLITTNDNINAIRFYQKRGFEISAIHRDAIQQSRLLKPSIPLLGYHDIPIKDEIELEIVLRRK